MVRMTADVVLGAPSRISPTEDWELHLRSESWSVRTLRSLTSDGARAKIGAVALPG
jgi:hypothetical protein